MEKILWVNATYQLPPCVPSLDLKYDLEFWKEGEEHKVGNPVLSQAGSPPHFSHFLRLFLHSTIVVAGSNKVVPHLPWMEYNEAFFI